jgi:arylsulfatase A-like enzyme
MLASSTAGCGSSPPARLVFLLDAEGAPKAPQIAELGGVHRPVLFRTESVGAGQGTDVVSASGQAAIRLELPPDLSVTPDLSIEALTSLDEQVRLRQVPIVRDRADGRFNALVDFEPRAAGRRFQYTLLATMLPSPGPRERTLGSVEVPPGATLRVHLGFEEKYATDHPVTRFEVDAAGDGAPRALTQRELDPAQVKGRWVPLEIPLDGIAGQTVAFRFRARSARAADQDRRLHVLWADPVIVAPGSRSARPNVILVSLDTLGARHLGTYGYGYPTSPNLDAIATEGTLFERAVCHYPSTAGSHMTLFTSLLPVAHGVRGLWDSLDRQVPTLPQVLRHAGFMTAAFTENATLAAGMGFARGFHLYRENRRTGRPTIGLARETLKRSLRWLRTGPFEPFFLFVHTYEVHSPYHPPRPYVSLARHDVSPHDEASPEQLYDGEIRFLDRLLAQFFRQLERLDLLDRTLIVVTSDHGEAFGEHGDEGHGDSLYENVMHVPLFVHGPGVPAGRRVDARVGLGDIMPTVLEMLGVPIPELVHGRSLVPYLRGESLDRGPFVAEVRGKLAPRPGPPDPDLRAVWMDDRKVIRDHRADTWEVYDLATDEAERRDLSPDLPGVIDTARQTLDAYEGLAGSAAPGTQADPEAPSQETLEKLRALGYTR